MNNGVPYFSTSAETLSPPTRSSPPGLVSHMFNCSGRLTPDPLFAAMRGSPPCHCWLLVILQELRRTSASCNGAVCHHRKPGVRSCQPDVHHGRPQRPSRPVP